MEFENFGFIVQEGIPKHITNLENDQIRINNVLIMNPKPNRTYLFSRSSQEEETTPIINICSLSKISPHMILDLPFTGSVIFNLNEINNDDGEEENNDDEKNSDTSSLKVQNNKNKKVQLHLIGQKIKNIRNNTENKNETIINSLSHSSLLKRKKEQVDEDTNNICLLSENQDDDDDDDDDEDKSEDEEEEEEEDDLMFTSSTKSMKQQKKIRKKQALLEDSQSKQQNNERNNNSLKNKNLTDHTLNDDEKNDISSLSSNHNLQSTNKPNSEEEYKQAIIMYLRQHGTTTLNKLGMAIKKPKCVKKSLRKFVGTIKCTKAKRLGTSLEIVGENVHLIQKANY